MKKKILLVPLALLLAASLVAIGCPPPVQPDPVVVPAVPVQPVPVGIPAPISFPSQIISAEWLVANIDNIPNLKLIDMRPRDAYLAGHIPGAVNLPWAELRVTQAEGVPEVRRTIEDFESLMGHTFGITRENPVVIYAAVGTHAARLLWELNLHGHFDVAVLNGQFPAWTAAGGAVSVDPPPVEPAFFVSQFQPHLLATNHSIADIMGDQGYVIVDNRVYDQYAGTVPGPGIAPERAGHIPGVLHWVAADYYAAGFFMPVDEFVAKAVARGITKDKNIIVTCRSGHSATALYILLSAAGFNNVALHDHSWLGWNIEDYLPRARK